MDKCFYIETETEDWETSYKYLAGEKKFLKVNLIVQ